MKTLFKSNFIRSPLSLALAFSLFAGASYAQSAAIPAYLQAKEISSAATRSIKQALNEPAEPCGMEGAHEKHQHDNKVRELVLSRDASTITDSSRKLIFSQNELSLYQISTLVETLGELNSEDTDKLLRSVYEYADTLAENITVEIDDDKLKQQVINSNRDDIKIAVLAALEKNGSKNLDDLLSKAAAGEGYLANRSQALLKTQKR